MECTIVDEPGLLIEIDRLHDQRVTFPTADSIAQIACREPFSMRTAIRWDNTEKAAIHIVIEEHDLAGILNDLIGRPNTRHAWRLALQHRVGLDLAIAKIFDFGQKLGLVLRKVWCCWGSSRTTTAGRGSRRWATKHANRSIRQSLGPHKFESPGIPRPVQVGSAIC